MQIHLFMPQISSKSISSSFNPIQWMIWEITEELPFFQTFPTQWLLNGDKVNQKTLESSAARFCLWQLCQKISNDEWHFQKDIRNKPHFEQSDYHISLSHSYPFVAAAICKGNQVGIDVEIFGRNVEKIGPRFLSLEEWEIRQNSQVELTKAWTCKEAVYKAVGVPGLSFQQEIMLPNESVHIFDIHVKEKNITIQIEEFGRFTCAIAKVN